jgi:hypothetical protein
LCSEEAKTQRFLCFLIHWQFFKVFFLGKSTAVACCIQTVAVPFPLIHLINGIAKLKKGSGAKN